MHHVFDFLNQMGLMSEMPGFLADGAFAAWTVFPGMEDTIRNRPVPGLVSIRTSMDNQLENGSTYHVVSVVFENGVFVNIPVAYPPDGSSVQERMRFFAGIARVNGRPQRQAKPLTEVALAGVFGLSASQIGRRINAAAKAAGLGDGFTGHASA